VWCFYKLIVLIAIGLLIFTLVKLPTNMATLIASILIVIVSAEISRIASLGWRGGRIYIAAAATGLGALAIVGIVYGLLLPNVMGLRISQRVADSLRAEGATSPGAVIMIDYKEPSLAFYQGGTIREESNTRFLTETEPFLWPRWIVMTRKIWDEQPANVRASGNP